MIEEFTNGPDDIKDRLNQMIREIAGLKKIVGSPYINVNRMSSGTTISLNTNKVRELFPMSNRVRRAITTEAAGAAVTITANLYGTDGIEQETGDEAGVTVYCTVTGGANLNEAIPALVNDADIFVVKLPYDNAGDVEYRWYCLQVFQSMDNC